MTRVSVVTVTFNDVEHLKPTVASVLAQVGVDLEYVIVDGASSDGTQRWLDAHARGARVLSEPDRGLFDAMNKGLAMATGTIVTFLNAGDTYVRPTVLADVVWSYERSPWRWSYGRARVVNEAREQVRPLVGIRRYRAWKHAWNLNPICHQATYAETRFLRQLGGFSLDRGNASDFDLLLRAGVQDRPRVLDTVDVDYLSGGVSELDAYRQVLRKHAIRVDAFGLGPMTTRADRALTTAQLGYLAAKRSTKRMAPQGAQRWWSRRGSPSASATAAAGRTGRPPEGTSRCR